MYAIFYLDTRYRSVLYPYVSTFIGKRDARINGISKLENRVELETMEQYTGKEQCSQGKYIPLSMR